MVRKIYKSLDRAPSICGLQTTYFILFVVCALMCVLLGVFLGILVVNWLGIGVGLGGSAFCYLYMAQLQARLKNDNSELERWMSGRKVPEFIAVGPDARSRALRLAGNGTLATRFKGKELD